MKRKYVVLNKFGRPFAAADSLQDIADRTGVPLTSIHMKYQQGKPTTASSWIASTISSARCSPRLKVRIDN